MIGPVLLPLFFYSSHGNLSLAERCPIRYLLYGCWHIKHVGELNASDIYICICSGADITKTKN